VLKQNTGPTIFINISFADFISFIYLKNFEMHAKRQKAKLPVYFQSGQHNLYSIGIDSLNRILDFIGISDLVRFSMVDKFISASIKVHNTFKIWQTATTHIDMLLGIPFSKWFKDSKGKTDELQKQETSIDLSLATILRHLDYCAFNYLYSKLPLCSREYLDKLQQELVFLVAFHDFTNELPPSNKKYGSSIWRTYLEVNEIPTPCDSYYRFIREIMSKNKTTIKNFFRRDCNYLKKHNMYYLSDWTGKKESKNNKKTKTLKKIMFALLESKQIDQCFVK
jgi:hypothetical protein